MCLRDTVAARRTFVVAFRRLLSGSYGMVLSNGGAAELRAHRAHRALTKLRILQSHPLEAVD
jgi:hypothetical protein